MADVLLRPLQLQSSPAAAAAPLSSAGDCFPSEPSAAAPPNVWLPETEGKETSI